MTATELNSPAPTKKDRNKLLPIVLLFLLLLGSGGYLLYMYPSLIGLSSSTTASSSSSEDREATSAEAFDKIIPLEEIIINIRDRGFQRLFKLSIALELLNSQDYPEVKKNLPVLLDSFQSHLRGLRIVEIEGSRAIYRIKEELIARANIVLHPIRIKNILFSELLVQ